MAPAGRRTIIVEDDQLEWFWTLPELARRTPGVPWEIEYVTISISDLLCPYPSPGDADAPPAGLMGGVGWPPGKAGGHRIVDLANAIREGLANGTADTANVSLARVVMFRDQGVEYIHARAQALAVIECLGNWYVREGVHRTVALALLGVDQVEAMNLSFIRQRAA